MFESWLPWVVGSLCCAVVGLYSFTVCFPASVVQWLWIAVPETGIDWKISKWPPTTPVLHVLKNTPETTSRRIVPGKAVEFDFSEGRIDPEQSTLNVVTWNVNYGKRLADIVEAMKQEQPDILFLQEDAILVRDGRQLVVSEEIAKALKMHGVYVVSYVASEGCGHGTAVLSKLPLEDVSVITTDPPPVYSGVRGMMNGGQHHATGRITHRGQGFRVVAAHLNLMGGKEARSGALTHIVTEARKLEVKPCGLLVGGDFNNVEHGLVMLSPFHSLPFWSRITNGHTTEAGWLAKKLLPTLELEQPPGAVDSQSTFRMQGCGINFWATRLDWLIVGDCSASDVSPPVVWNSPLKVAPSWNCGSDHRWVSSTLAF